MAIVEATDEVNLPAADAYKLWSRFESFPVFMEGIESVRRLSDDRFRFTGNLYGHKRSWEARVVDEQPPTRLEWESVAGARNHGTVLFHPITPRRTRIAMTLEFEAESLTEKAGDAIGAVEARVHGDLGRFREFAESGPKQRRRHEQRARAPDSKRRDSYKHGR